MTAASRKSRAAATQRIIAAHLAGNGWPHATDTGAGRTGRDILGVLGVAIEVKARRDYNPLYGDALAQGHDTQSADGRP